MIEEIINKNSNSSIEYVESEKGSISSLIQSNINNSSLIKNSPIKNNIISKKKTSKRIGIKSNRNNLIKN